MVRNFGDDKDYVAKIPNRSDIELLRVAYHKCAGSIKLVATCMIQLHS